MNLRSEMVSALKLWTPGTDRVCIDSVQRRWMVNLIDFPSGVLRLVVFMNKSDLVEEPELLGLIEM